MIKCAKSLDVLIQKSPFLLSDLLLDCQKNRGAQLELRVANHVNKAVHEQELIR